MPPKAADKAKKVAPAKEKASSGTDSNAGTAPGGAMTNTLAEFEAGILFSKYDSTRSGVLTSEDFRKIWKEARTLLPSTATQPSSSSATQAGSAAAATFKQSTDGDLTAVLFEAGQVFTSFDKDGDGNLSKAEFEALIRSHPDILNLNKIPDSHVKADKYQPLELITGRLLTHFDETAGISISSDSVDQHRTMGHTVVPLIDAYKLRYDRLRALLATKVLPRREYLIQLRRQLTNVSSEVEAVRKGIERETLIDTDKIIERLKTVEFSRSTGIAFEEKKVDAELDNIERLIRLVDKAHEENIRHNLGLSGVSTVSAMFGSTPHESIRAPRSALMVDLIQQYGDICVQIDKISSKKLSVQTLFQTADFPRETVGIS